jgi:hypothetical protein
MHVRIVAFTVALWCVYKFIRVKVLPNPVVLLIWVIVMIVCYRVDAFAVLMWSLLLLLLLLLVLVFPVLTGLLILLVAALLVRTHASPVC